MDSVEIILNRVGRFESILQRFHEFLGDLSLTEDHFELLILKFLEIEKDFQVIKEMLLILDLKGERENDRL